MAYGTVPFHGKTAKVEKNDVAFAYGQDWSINVTGDWAEGSRQGQSWGEGLPGIYRWTGSMTLQLVLGNTEVKAIIDNIITANPGVKLTDMKFLLDISTNAFTGDLYIMGFNTAPSVGGGLVTCGVNFNGNGALAPTDGA